MTIPNETTTIDRNVDIVTDHGIIDAHLYYPAADGTWPGVLLLTDIRGTRPAFEAIARRLTANGYVVLLPNIYYRAGRAPVLDPNIPFGDEATRARRQELRATLTPEAVHADLAALTDYLAGDSHVRAAGLGVVGYCLTGAFALAAAADFPELIVAAASFHGGGLATDAPESPHRRADRIKARLYFGHADQDPSIPAEMIERLEAALRQAGVAFRSEVYAGARHGFAVADGQSFSPDAAERHWRNLIDLLDTAF